MWKIIQQQMDKSGLPYYFDLDDCGPTAAVVEIQGNLLALGVDLNDPSDRTIFLDLAYGGEKERIILYPVGELEEVIQALKLLASL